MFGLTCSVCGVTDAHDNTAPQAVQHTSSTYLASATVRGWICVTNPLPTPPKCPVCAKL
jgi:hypothetical protein